MLNLVWIGLGGALGSICRFAISQWFPWNGSGFPTATFLTNILASFILGLLMGLVMSKFSHVPALKYFAIVGFCGGFSTFSTFAFEAFKLNQSGELGVVLLYALSSVLISVFLIYLGYSILVN